MKKLFVISILSYLLLPCSIVFAVDINPQEQAFSQKLQSSVKYGNLSSEKLKQGDTAASVSNLTKSIELGLEAKQISTQNNLDLTAEDKILLDKIIADYYINRGIGLELGLNKSSSALEDMKTALSLASDPKTVDRVLNFVDSVIAQKKYAQAEKYLTLVIGTPNIDRIQLSKAYQTRAVVRQNHLDDIPGGNQDYQNYLRYK